MVMVTSATVADADDEATEGVDIMIIIDKSDSMNWNDPDTETLEATYQILTLSLGTNNRVGFVVYNDTIIAYQGLQVIETQDDIDEIMEELHDIQISRGTDIGLALQTASRQLEMDSYRVGRTAIIFLSDGWFEFELFNPNRNQDDVMADVEDVVTNVSYPIFTIQYSIGYDHQSPKREWGEQTGGGHFTAGSSDEMIEAVTEVYQAIIEDAGVPVESDEVHEHQLIIPIPHTETERTERVEVTLVGGGLIQGVVLPADHEYITVDIAGSNYIITITDPGQESYTIYYRSFSETPLEYNILTQMVDIPPGSAIPWGMIGIGVSGIIALIVLVLLIVKVMKKQKAKKQYPTFNSMLECYFMEIPTGTKAIPIQSWSASFLAVSKKISLGKLLKNVALRDKMPEAEKIFVSIHDDNVILVDNKAGIQCYKDGKEVMEPQVKLHNSEGLYMVFKKNTIEIELRAKQSSLRYPK